jgi:small conductance mechanosensitive channel
MLSGLFPEPVYWRPILTALLPTLVAAWLAARFARRLAAGVIRAIVGDTLAPSSSLVRGPLRLVSIATFVLVLAVMLFPALDAAGLHPQVGQTFRGLMTWLVGPGVRVLLIALIAYALRHVGNLLVQRFEKEVNEGTNLDSFERAKRARTLGSIVNRVVASLIIGIGAVMILNELGINIAPVLTGAGIVGIAIGFGAQTVVRDLLSGFFLILEDQVRVGDFAGINGTQGLVEQINLRTIIVRDIRGTVHVFPNGTINTLANLSKEFSIYVIELDLFYKEDADRVIEIVREVDRELSKDPQFAPYMLAPVEINGIVSFSYWSMQLRISLKTAPQKQWRVGREFRKRVRKAMNRQGIEVPPYPAVRLP